MIVIFTLLILAQLVFTKGPLGYELWAGIFSPTWMRLLTVIVVLGIAWHAWLGMCEIFMDYIKSAGLKSGLQIFTALWLLGSVAWFVSVLWKF
ncbi:MAG: succinate dehydrogenase, hydrophobic membrane anchor protein [Rhodoferax sp.]|nr:succinate dehydrogenase, hydrophobic membrane anchor protein [Rhodoferax sp.]